MIEMLEYDGYELLGDGWRRIIPSESWGVVNNLIAATRRNVGGIWRFDTVSRSGDVLGLVLHVMPDGKRMMTRGVATEFRSAKHHAILKRSKES